MRACCNQVVGVIIHDRAGRLLMFQRATPPAGVAPAAGHVGEHGDPEAAAIAEVREEVGLTVTGLELLATRWLPDSCGSRQLPGPQGFDHHWSIYRADVTGVVAVDVREAVNPRWCTPAQVQALADRTVDWAHGGLTDTQFTARPGLEPVWVLWLHHLGLIHVSPADLSLITPLACRPAGRP